MTSRDHWFTKILLDLTGTTDIKMAAAFMAEREIRDSGLRCPSILEIAARHNIWPLLREVTYGPSGSVGKSGEDYVISLRAGESEVRRRFTLAHELGHVVIAEASGRELRDTSDRIVERFLDEFAGRILLPEQMMLDWISSAGSRLSVRVIERGSRDLLVSVRVLVKRLGDSGALDQVGQALIIGTIGRARKTRLESALRVHQVATPTWCFIPLNRRLSSIGLQVSADFFGWACREKGTTRSASGRAKVKVKVRPSYEWREVSSTIEQKVYKLRTGERYILVLLEIPREIA